MQQREGISISSLCLFGNFLCRAVDQFGQPQSQFREHDDQNDDNDCSHQEGYDAGEDLRQGYIRILDAALDHKDGNAYRRSETANAEHKEHQVSEPYSAVTICVNDDGEEDG